MLPGEMDGKRFLRALARLGWEVERVCGSHRVLRGPAGRHLVVAFHASIGRNSIRRALQEAGIPEDAFERVR